MVRDFIHVADMADLCALCAKINFTGIYNVGSGEGVSIKQIIDIITTVTGRDIRPDYKPSRGFDVPRVVLDISAIRAKLPWKPTTSLNTGIEGTWKWILEHKNGVSSSK